MSEQPGGDVVDLLLRQHGALRRLCAEVTSAAPGAKEEPFRSLVRLLAVHEAVEEEIVHPYVKRRGQRLNLRASPSVAGGSCSARRRPVQ